MRKITLLTITFLSLFSHAKEQAFQVFFTANRQGEIEPCHCTTNQIGGLSRLENYLEKTKRNFKGESFFVDSGDTFFSLSKFPEALIEREFSKAELIAKAYKKWKVDYILFGERDLALGVPKLSELLQKTGAHFPPPDVALSYEVIEKGKIRLGIIAVLKPESIDKAIAELKEKKVNQIVVLSHLGQEEDKKTAEKYENILIVGAHTIAGNDKPLMVGKSAIVETLEEGKNIGRVVFDSKSVTEAQYEFINLDKSFEKENKISKMVREHTQYEKNKTITKDNKAVKKIAGPSFVANPFACKHCHKTQFDFWKNTKHSSAYLVLFAKNQHFDPDCVSCHVLGFEKPEGFQKISQPLLQNGKPQTMPPFVETILQTVFKGDKAALDSRREPERHKKLHDKYLATVEKMVEQKKLQKIYMGVQCEHCHGNRSHHLATGERGKKTTVPQTCLSCHRAPNAPEFTASMIPLASCPKMN